ncbi:Uncharacterised protein [Bordetella pertussis]|nr:Uncharacterised protein [Bordetella pertussis]
MRWRSALKWVAKLMPEMVMKTMATSSTDSESKCAKPSS